VEPYDVAMVKEGTPGKYKLRAVQPGSRRPVIETYATRDAVDARKAALERAEYTVIIREAATLRELLAPRAKRLQQADLPA
jgi:hypothetical protein